MVLHCGCAGSSGVFDRTGIPHGDYTLRVIARDLDRPNEAPAITRNRLWVHGDDIFCVTRLINRGVTVEGNTFTVDFAATGVVQSYVCSLDRTEYFECKATTPKLMLCDMYMHAHVVSQTYVM